MGNIIPFFHYDLLARVAPGILVIALLQLTPFKGQSLLDWLGKTGAAQAVLVPLLYGGIAYVTGLFLDVLLSRPILRPLYRRGFRNALRHYPFPAPAPSTATAASYKVDLDKLGKLAFDFYVIRSANDLPAEQPHGLRFHAEAKFFAHSATVLASFESLLLLHWLCGSGWVTVFEPAWVGLVLLLMMVFIYAAALRGQRLADQILSFVDNLEGTDTRLLHLQGDLAAGRALLLKNGAPDD